MSMAGKKVLQGVWRKVSCEHGAEGAGSGGRDMSMVGEKELQSAEGAVLCEHSRPGSHKVWRGSICEHGRRKQCLQSAEAGYM
jgi:hypothetical protein